VISRKSMSVLMGVVFSRFASRTTTGSDMQPKRSIYRGRLKRYDPRVAAPQVTRAAPRSAPPADRLPLHPSPCRCQRGSLEVWQPRGRWQQGHLRRGVKLRWHGWHSSTTTARPGSNAATVGSSDPLAGSIAPLARSGGAQRGCSARRRGPSRCTGAMRRCDRRPSAGARAAARGRGGVALWQGAAWPAAEETGPTAAVAAGEGRWGEEGGGEAPRRPSPEAPWRPRAGVGVTRTRGVRTAEACCGSRRPCAAAAGGRRQDRAVGPARAYEVARRRACASRSCCAARGGGGGRGRSEGSWTVSAAEAEVRQRHGAWRRGGGVAPDGLLWCLWRLALLGCVDSGDP
jgi:hypothetical protein